MMPVTIRAPSRLHFGLFNESGLDGRIDGGAGVAIADPSWRLSVRPVFAIRAGMGFLDINAKRFEQDPMLDRFAEHFGTPALELRIDQPVEGHVGLGAGTSRALAIGRATALLAGAMTTDVELAAVAQRGGTSGVGVHLASRGGLVVDNGRTFPSEKAQFGPSSACLASPPELRLQADAGAQWRVIHVRAVATRGLHGSAEGDFFARACPVPDAETRELLELVERVLLPALRESDLGLLHAFLERIQGLGLKRREWAEQPRPIIDFADAWARERESDPALSPLCLSSMGPTTFCITADPERERVVLRRLGLGAQAVETSISGGYSIEEEASG